VECPAVSSVVEVKTKSAAVTEFTVMFEEARPDVEEAGFRTMWAEPRRDQDRLGLSCTEVNTLIAGLPIVRELDTTSSYRQRKSTPDPMRSFTPSIVIKIWSLAIGTGLPHWESFYNRQHSAESHHSAIYNIAQYVF